jgi:hypothetical protein
MMDEHVGTWQAHSYRRPAGVPFWKEQEVLHTSSIFYDILASTGGRERERRVGPRRAARRVSRRSGEGRRTSSLGSLAGGLSPWAPLASRTCGPHHTTPSGRELLHVVEYLPYHVRR